MKRAAHLLGRAVRETGQATDRLGLTISNVESFKETFSRHRQVMNLYDKRPLIAAEVFVAPNASVIGEVLLLNEVSIWYGAILRGDKNKIKIGSVSNVQDRAVITTVSSLESQSGFHAEVDIGDYVSIGAGSILTSCTIGSRVTVGQGSVIGQGTVIEDNCVIAPGSVVLNDTLIKKGQFWAGNPAKYIRDIDEEENSNFSKDAELYSTLASQHSGEFLPFGTAYQAAEEKKL